MAKVEKRQKQEEEAADKMKQAEIEYKAKIDVANQKQNKIKDETSNTARELQVRLRVVQTQAILFLKSISERDGSDSEFQNRCMADPPLSDIDFKNKMTWVCP